MARLIYNNQSGLLGASLTSSGTTITFASAPKFATLTSPDYIPLILSPATPNFEIVYLTAYTALATTGTITRAAEDSTNWPAVAHSDSWVCGPTVNDGQWPVNTPAGRIYLSSNTGTLAAGTTYNLSNFSVDFVRGGVTSNGYNLVAPVSGKYQINANLICLPNTGSNGNHYLQIYKNGSLWLQQSGVVTANSFSPMSFAQVLTLAAGDTLLYYYNTAGGGTVVVNGAPSTLTTTDLSIALVSTP